MTIGKRKYFDKDTGQLLLGEGEYGRGRDGIWYARPPGHHMGCLRSHEVVEHEDGTITVSPSILVQYDDETPDWHGYLRAGVWQPC